MLDIKITTQLHKEKVAQAVDKGAFRNIFHAAASLAKDVRGSLLQNRRPSRPGYPPHTGRRRKLRRAIYFHVDRENNIAVIGPRASIAGQSGAAHEFGGRYLGARFEERPFMKPALERAAPRFAGSFAGSIGE